MREQDEVYGTQSFLIREKKINKWRELEIDISFSAKKFTNDNHKNNPA